MYKFYNANPLRRHVNDCTVRAISLATGETWDNTYRRLSHFAQVRCVMPDDVGYIDEYLENHFTKIFSCKANRKITVGDFITKEPFGTFLVTMNGHITCVIDGIVYDTFDPCDRFVWGVYKV